MTAARVAHLAELMSYRAERVAFVAAVMLTLSGVYLLWSGPRQRMSMEEHVKDGDLSEDVGERRLRIRVWIAALMIVAGLGFVILVTFS
jgi:hypothetical protein